MAALDEVRAECLAHRVRMAARSIGRVYDEAMRPLGLKATQFTLLVAITNNPANSISRLAEALAMERTTMTRNLALLERDGMIKVGVEGYRRERNMKLTPKGERTLRNALPLWRRAQNQVVAALGGKDLQATRKLLEALSAIE